MREYTISRRLEPFSWENVPALSIDNLLWTDATQITAQAQLCYDQEALYVRLSAKEQHIRAEETGPLCEPCEDSCLEFFFSPMPSDNRYFNIEFNPNGCIYLGFGSNFQNLVRLIPEEMSIVPTVNRFDGGWEITYSIPCSFIRLFFQDFTPRSGSFIRANCYKCGEATVSPHYLAWNPVDLPEPCFHCPEFFGKMYFE